jgi:putative ABC transport system permease protein
MSSLDRKLLRDLWQMKGQALAIGLVLACGVATFVMALSAMAALSDTQAHFYDRCRFADVFAGLKRAPNSVGPRLAEIPGVARVQTRIEAEVTLDVPGLAEPAVGRLVSVPDRPHPGLNELYLRAGRTVEFGRPGEALVSEAFALAHGLGPGDRVRAVINGRRQQLKIVGVALSPEYVYQIRPGDIFPDDKRFGIFWMGYTELAVAFDMEGGFNSVSLTLAAGAPELEVIRRLDRVLAPYGGVGAYGRADQVSNRFLSDEIRQLRANAVIVPGIFLGVSAFLLNVVLSRLVGTQREQIAALKAFGYTHWEVGLHYLKLVLALVVFGALVGTAVGYRLALLMTEMYAQFYRFPEYEFTFDPGVVALALTVSAAASVAGALGAVRKAVRLPPAEALRPEPPATYRPTVLERWGLQRLFSQAARMVLRNLERQPVKALLSVGAIALAVAILVVGSFTEDAIDYMMDYQFVAAQRQDVMVTLVEPASARALGTFSNLPGVLRAEPFRSVPVRLRRGHRERRVGVMGLARPDGLFRVIDSEERAVPLPPEGLLVSAKLAELLGASVGDAVTVEVMEGERPVREAPVAGLVHDYTGTSAYMSLSALNRLLREGGSVSGAFLTVDPARADVLYRKLKATPAVAGVSVKRAMLRSFWETIAQNLLVMRTFNVTFACVIAFGVVYNNARISLAERSRELATLRVIGFSRAEISAILLGELGVLTLVAIPAGLALGYGLAALASWALDTEMYRIPLVVHPATFGLAAAVVLAATVASGLIVRRRLDHLDLVAVLKTKE